MSAQYETRLVPYYLVIALLIVWLFWERAQGAVYRITLEEQTILIRQVLGDGCGYQDSCSNFTINGFSGWGWRNSNFRCRMIAARCLIERSGHETDLISSLEALRKAQQQLPDIFDTGDGVIYYGECIRAAISSLEAGENRLSTVSACH